LTIIGQSEQMKITYMAAGSAFLNSQEPDGQPGERAHGLQQRDDRRRHVREEAEAADHEAERNADQRRQPEADGDPPSERSTFQPIPWSFGPLL
jgi:hypothetical protein